MRLYESLCKIFNEVNHLDNIINLLQWDATVVIPESGIEDRANQLNTLSAIKYDILTNRTVTSLVQETIKQKSTLDPWQSANLSHMDRIHSNAKIIPINLLQAFNKASVISQNVWKTAKQENNFKSWLPHFQKVINLSRDIASIKAEFFNCSKYEALLRDYEPGLSVDKLNTLFGEVGEFLRDFIKKIVEQQAPVKEIDLSASEQHQQQLSEELLQLMQIPRSQVRLDTSEHPFTTGNQFDTRITVKYHEQDLYKGMRATLHEGGHALYNLNLPLEFYGNPVGESMGMAMHEAQALLFENHIGSSLEFTTYISKVIKGVLAKKSLSIKNMYNAINYVQPSPIRIHADEVTYPIHIMIRYTIEKALIEGELQAQDLPQAWEEDMKYYLGVTPSNDSEGCMQDIHWATGSFGYFPSYLLGTIISAQLFSKIKEQVPDVMKQISNGNLEQVIDWLTNNIYKNGRRYDMREMLDMSVGSTLDVKSYIDYLQSKYDK